MITWVEVKNSAIQHNLKQFQKITNKKAKIMAIVKSNAYGHGMVEIAKLVVKAKVDWLGVVNLAEALVLCRAKIKKPIFILSFWPFNSQVKQGIKYNIDFPVYTLGQAKFLSKIAQQLKKQVNIHIKVDTGASRIGILPNQAPAFIKKITQLPNLKLRGIFTHYADSESKNQSYTNQQTTKLKKVINDLEIAGLKVPFVHAGCSASTINNPNTFFNLVRIGISLYGFWPSKETKEFAKLKKIKINLKPALTWQTRIIQIKQVEKNTNIGYNKTFKTKKKTKLAILPIGYWDGYSRLLSNPSTVNSGQGEVLIHEKRCPVLGRICMNLTMIDVSKLNKVKINDKVVLIGKQGKEEITAEEIAQKTKTINYEVITRINPLIPRIYI